MKKILLGGIKKITRYKFLTNLDKRQRFALQTVFLTIGLLVTQLIWDDYRFLIVGILSVLSYVLSVYSLKEDIKGIEWLILFILPVLFTASVSLFYYLLPARWIIRLVVGSMFAIGIYACLLVENIYNVAAQRSIQLLRAAQSIGLMITLIVVFLSVTIIFSTRSISLINMIEIIPLVFILSLQSLWSVNLVEKITFELILYSAVVALSIGELAFALSFWPIQVSTAALLMTATYYSLVGIIQQHIMGRLFRNTISEYIFAIVFTIFIALISTNWG